MANRSRRHGVAGESRQALVVPPCRRGRSFLNALCFALILCASVITKSVWAQNDEGRFDANENPTPHRTESNPIELRIRRPSRFKCDRVRNPNANSLTKKRERDQEQTKMERQCPSRQRMNPLNDKNPKCEGGWEEEWRECVCCDGSVWW